jgi:hypothetical protein
MIFIVLLTFLFSACAPKIHMAPKEMETQSKEFYPSANRAYIYIYRIGGFTGSGALLPVKLDGELMGALAIETYFMFEVYPGQHTIIIGYPEVREVKESTFRDLYPINIDTLVGDMYFISIEWLHPEVTGIELRQVSEIEGKKYVKQYKMALPIKR